ncbi:hypothetical protein P171DRAFT_370719 [Karstenula rhodostoma CBS 690.94]|uniref:CFEM domain-containing protein n=1 Tax=Karstenula rhodostoma CBS 690.94 TaxID=1392251 RepID=A0A9P4P8C0_9PLEO|nr:hypothetical protein P171DRAFT_370719 [Karstenula rhodostoma CBS 690.94]
MGFLLRKLLSFYLLGVVWVTVAQFTIPECAQPCLLMAFATNTCSPTDLDCMCTNEIFQNNVTLCVGASCTVPDQLGTLNGAIANSSLTTCGAPVYDRGPKYIVLSNTMCSISVGFVVVRFAFKILVARVDIGWDDWAVLATMIMSIPSAVVTVYGTVEHGLGQHIWTLRPDQITTMLEYFYIMTALYFTQSALLKLCLVLFYIRVFPSQGVQRLLWATVVFVVASAIIFVLVAIFQCTPVHHFWEQWDGLHEGHCVNINAVTITHAAISIALDVWILGVPMWQLRKLKMHWQKKAGVGLMFCVGTFVTIVSILRFRAILEFAGSYDASWEFYNVSVWSTIEISTGIMCSCLPAVRQLLAKLFPIIQGSSAHSRQNYYIYDESKELQKIGRSNTSHDVRIATIASSGDNGSAEFKDDRGIVVETSYTIKRHNDVDEVSLVSHEDRYVKGGRVG